MVCPWGVGGLFGVVGVVVGAGVELGFFAELFKCVLEDQGVE
jgi:hypothetical protein